MRYAESFILFKQITKP